MKILLIVSLLFASQFVSGQIKVDSLERANEMQAEIINEYMGMLHEQGQQIYRLRDINKDCENMILEKELLVRDMEKKKHKTTFKIIILALYGIIMTSFALH